MAIDAQQIRRFLDPLLVSKDVDVHLEELQKSGYLEHLFPEVEAMVGFGGKGTGHKDLWWHTKLVVKQTIPVVTLRWASLFHDIGKPTCFKQEGEKISFHHHEAASARLFRSLAKRTQLFTKEECKEISFILYNLGHVEGYSSRWTDSAVRRAGKILAPYRDSVFAVARADCTSGNPHTRRKMAYLTHDLRARIVKLEELDTTPPALPSGLGEALAAHLGIDHGPELGSIMRELKARVEAGELPRNDSYDTYLQALA